MPIHNRYLPASISRYLSPDETGFTDVLHEAGRLVLDAELILIQDIRELARVRALARQSPSGFVKGAGQTDNYTDFSFRPPWLPGPVINSSFTADAFWMKKVQALVAGMLIDIEYTNTDEPGQNLIQLDRATIYNGTPPTVKRTDFVFLEVWLTAISPSPSARGTFVISSTISPNIGDTITVDGVIFTGVAIVPGPLQFRIFPNPVQTAASIATQVNAAVPSVTCVANGPVVQITAATPGAAGNLITLASSNGAAIAPSGLTLTGGADTSGKPTQDTVYRNGNVLSPVSVALPDNMEDPDVGMETTKRLQIQYRIRTTGASEGVNFKSQCDGFSNPNILAQGSQGAPVGGYPFVPADLTTVLLNSDARDGGSVGYGILDNGLYIAGNGTEAAATALGTVDGFVYAIPIAFVFRRNDALGGGGGNGWDPIANTNGALPHDHAPFLNPFLFTIVQMGESDRPDGYFHDAIVETDVLDLRRHVRLMGHDLASETQYQIASLMDGDFRTWAIDTASKQMLGNGSGDVSTRNLVCNEIGRTTAKGGNAPFSGDTNRGVTIRNFDHAARRFGDQPVVERVVFEMYPQAVDPGKYNVRPAYAVGFLGWAEGDTLHIDLLELNATTLGNWNPADATIPGPAPTGTVLDYSPPGTLITDVLSIFHDDGNFDVAVDQSVVPTTIIGLGTSHVEITLDTNTTPVNGGIPGPTHDMVGTNGTGDVGSQRRIFIELEITYPLGVGLTDTPQWLQEPDPGPFPYGPMVEDWIPTGISQAPLDMETRLPPAFRQGYREVMVEYVSNDPTGGGGNTGVPIGTLTPETVVSRDPLNIVANRRFFGSSVKTVEVVDQNDGNPRDVDDPNTHYGSSSRLIVLRNTGIAPAVPLSGAGQTLVALRYFGQDAVPNYGSAGQGYQQSIYYRTTAPQTAGVKEGVLGSGVASFPYVGAPGPMPSPLLVEPMYVQPMVWSGQRGTGSTELGYPHFVPLDQIPVNDGRSEIPPPPPNLLFPGEHVFAASANISIADFDAQVGTLALHTLVPAEKSITWTIGGTLPNVTPFQDQEFRAVYPMINAEGHRPVVMAQSLSNVTIHKVFVVVMARSLQDSVLFRKDEVLMLIMSRWARLDPNNTLEYIDSGSTTGVGVFRTKNLLLCAGE